MHNVFEGYIIKLYKYYGLLSLLVFRHLSCDTEVRCRACSRIM